MSVLDPEVAGQLAEDLPPEVFARIVATFEADAARILEGLAAAAADPAAFARGAHALAGAAGSVGARTLADLARRGMAPDDVEGQALLLPLIRAETRAAVAALRAMAAAGR